MVRKVLVVEPLAQAGLDLLRSRCQITMRLDLTPEELVQVIGEYDGLIVRSGAQVTEQVLSAAPKLAVVGRAGTGVDNIDLDAATRRGIVVVNAPTSNTIAVAEHTLGLMLSLARRIPWADATMRAGRWKKKDALGTELRDKTLGLIGLGRAGTAVARRAQGLEMNVVAHDPFVSPERGERLNVEMVGLGELLALSDYVSLHAPSTERTRGMIGTDELEAMKPSAYLINCARGDLIVEEALVEALREGKISGAALDVFVDEPHVSDALRGCPNLILTPHLGASTLEAQSGAAIQVARQVVDVLEGRPPRHPVNVTALSTEELSILRPYLDLANRLGRFYAQFAENNLTHLEMIYAGETAEGDTTLLTASALAGLFSEAGEESVNLVNARLVARERGLTVSETRVLEVDPSSETVSLRARTTTKEHLLGGAVVRGRPQIVRIDGFWLDFAAQGLLLVTEHIEQPGVIGQMGTLLGDAGVNISFVEVGREEIGGYGLMVMGLDEPISGETLAQIMTLPSVRTARVISL